MSMASWVETERQKEGTMEEKRTYTSVLLADRGKATSLSVLVDGVGDPVDSGVSSDGLVRGIDEDDLVVLVNTVLVDPVRVKDSQVT
jgi:hypothetical protein